MPEKKVYSINNNGKKHYVDLMYQYSETSIDYCFDFNSCLVNISKFNKKHAPILLKNIQQQLTTKRHTLSSILVENKTLPLSKKISV